MSYYNPTYRDTGAQVSYAPFHIVPTSNNTFDLGSSARQFRTAYIGSLSVTTLSIGSSTGLVKATAGALSVSTLVNADVSASAAIAYSKLNLASSIVDADIANAAAIAYSKLTLASSIVNADINGSAAIAYSKLALTGSILNADISGSAAIAGSKVSPDFGAQNILTTGAVTGARMIVTGSTVPANGIYLPSANTLGFAANSTAYGSISSAGAWTIGATSSTETHTLLGAQLTATPSTASSDFLIQHGQQNGSLTLSSDNRGFATRGGAIVLYGNGHASKGDRVEFYGAGSLKLSMQSSGGAPYLVTTGTMQLDGRIGVGGADSSLAMVTAGATNPLAQTRQWAFATVFAGTSAATNSATSIVGFYAAPTTAAAAFTAPSLSCFYADGSNTKGAGSTVTRSACYNGLPTTMGTNNAFLTDNNTYVGSYAIHLTSSNPSVLSGYLMIQNQADPTAVVDGIKIGSVDISAGNASLSLRTETALVSEVVTCDRTLAFQHNGTTVKMMIKS